VAKIAVERTDKWIVVYRQVSIRARQPERTMLLVEEAEGLEMLADIRRKSQQLCSILANLRHQLVK
jgi:transposase-like protein